MMEEARNNGSIDAAKIGMVFDALGASEVITDEDIAEGVAAIQKEHVMKSFSFIPTTQTGWDAAENELLAVEKILEEWLAEQSHINQGR